MVTDTLASNRKSRILFGSCTSLAHEQPLWPAIASRSASAYVWVGDAIYADRNVGLNFSHFPPKPITQDATPKRLRRLYADQLSVAGYSKFLDTNITVFGTIDDHDYGSNNGDMTYAFKRESALAFVDFTGESSDSPIAKRAERGHGVYGVKVFDFDRPPGQELVSDEEAGIDPDIAAEMPLVPSYSKKSVAVFVLDCRTNKTPWATGWKKFFASVDGDFLGERQWTWFETAIGRSQASVNIIAQGLQIHSNKFPDGQVAEEWTRFPNAQQRLYNAVLQDNVMTPLFVSGDVHMAELLRKDCRRIDALGSEGSNFRPLMEMTTSGMTHSWGSKVCSRPDSLFTCRIPYTNLAAKIFMHFAHWVSPWTELLNASPEAITWEQGGAEGAKTGKQYSLELNFGEMEFDWEHEKVRARVLGREMGERPLLSAAWTFDQLRGHAAIGGSKAVEADFLREQSTLSSSGIDAGPWICVNHQGAANPLHFALGIVSSMLVSVTLAFFPMVILGVGVALLLRPCLKHRRKIKAM